MKKWVQKKCHDNIKTKFEKGPLSNKNLIITCIEVLSMQRDFDLKKLECDIFVIYYLL
jgi:hypothetical protein